MSYLLINLKFLSCVLNRVFKVERLNIKTRRCDVRIKRHYFTKASLYCPNTFKYSRHLIYIKAVTLLNFYKVKIRNKYEVILFHLCLKYKTRYLY